MKPGRLLPFILLCSFIFASAFFYLSESSDAAEFVDSAAILSKIKTEIATKTQPIEDPTGELTKFYEALARTAAKRPGAITRVTHFGDSLIEMELLPGPVRRLMQEKWGDSGHGFVLSSRPRAWYQPYDLKFDPDTEWVCLDMGLNQNIKDRRFGLGGATCMVFKGKPKIRVGTTKKGLGSKVSRFEILFPAEPKGGQLEVKVDRENIGTLNTKSAQYQDSYAVVDVQDASHMLTLKGLQDKMRLHGIILERDVPGVVYDACGINGSGVNTYLSVDKDHWIKQLQHRNPNLVIIGVGTNDAYPELNLKIYRGKIKALIARAKEALPDASFLFMAPLDRAEKRGAQYVSNPMSPRIVKAQREVAKEMGVAFWSAFDAMGGEGSMGRWYMAKPRLGAGDLFHPTKKGGQVLGKMFFNALMQGFAAHLKANGLPGPAPAAPADPLVKVEISK